MCKNGLDSRKIGYEGTFQRFQFDFLEVDFIFLEKVFPVLKKFLGVLINRIRKVEAYAKKELQRQMYQEICQ